MRKRHGFTIVEVSMFLAVTALLFVGITVGTQNSINQQRYADTVNNFADFLRNLYSQVSNPQSNGKGNSGQAIYGKLVTFGESYNLRGEQNINNEIFVYDVLGDANYPLGYDNLGESLKELGASVMGVMEEKQNNLVSRKYGLVGLVESYTPRWSSKIESINGEEMKMSVLVVRHPRSGTITTLLLNKTTEVNLNLKPFYSGGSDVYVDGECQSNNNCTIGENAKKFKDEMIKEWTSYTSGEAVFCVNPFGDSRRRQEVRIASGSRNSSGVQVVDLDSSENGCNK